MNTPRTTALSLILCWVTLALVSACDKKCQAPPTEIPKTITANPWRLTKTTNPSLKNNNRYTFIIMEYAPDFSGQVRKVVNNREFEQPFRSFKYNVASSSGKNGTLRIAYFEPLLEGEEGQENSAEPTEITDYRYTLGRTLNLTEVKTGYTYEFVPFVGIVDPDSNCTF